MLWLILHLGALTVGFFPEIVLPAYAGPMKPALQTLLASQVSFLLLIYPLMIRPATPLRTLVIEAVLWLACASPFVVAAAYISGAAMPDAVRAELFAISAFVAGWGLAALAGRGTGEGGLSAAISVIFVLGGPFAVYLCWEFFGVRQLLWQTVPATCAWSIAQAQPGLWIPQPLWAWLLWPAAGVGLMLLNTVLPPDRLR